MDIGSHLKKIRKNRSLTLSDVAAAIGVTTGFLSQVENGITVPSVNSLIEILGFYKVPLSDFFLQIEKRNVICVKEKDIETMDAGNGIKIALLASKLDNNVLESYRIESPIKAPLHLKPLSPEINGERFLLVSKGSIEVRFPDNTIILVKNDSLNFKSHLSCVITNIKTGSAEFFLNGTPPLL
jgi:transcriptional regulator with XRE-family HTH domain